MKGAGECPSSVSQTFNASHFGQSFTLIEDFFGEPTDRRK